MVLSPSASFTAFQNPFLHMYLQSVAMRSAGVFKFLSQDWSECLFSAVDFTMSYDVDFQPLINENENKNTQVSNFNLT